VKLTRFASDGIGRLAACVETNPRLWRFLANSHKKISKTLKRIGIQLPRHTPAGLRQLRKLISDSDEVANPADGSPCVLIVSPRGWATHLALDTLIAEALRIRGAKVFIWTCGVSMPICHITNSSEAPPMPCSSCQGLQKETLGCSNLNWITTAQFLQSGELQQMSDSVSKLSLTEILKYQKDGINVGEMARDSMNWFNRTVQIPDKPESIKMLRNFLLLAKTSCIAGERVLSKLKPDVLFMVNGIFTEERIVRSLGERLNIPYVTYERAFGLNHFVFSRNKLANHYDLSEHWEKFAKTTLSSNQANKLHKFLARWRTGKGTVVKYWNDPEHREEVIKRRFNITDERKVVTLFTNVVWDTAAFDRDIAFDDMWDWICSTIKKIEESNDLHLLIRVHPAEVRLEGRETKDRIVERLAKEFPNLPQNISIIPPDDDTSSYRLIEYSSMVLVYTSTVGLEASISGKKVIVAGDTHYRGKGFTMDPETKSQYFSFIDTGRASEPSLEKEKTEKAELYAYLFFLLYMYPFPVFKENRMGNPHLTIKKLEELKPNNLPDLDRICDFILHSVGQHDPLALLVDDIDGTC
jgi:hypothetical protein